jgi:hypothetical protein
MLSAIKSPLFAILLAGIAAILPTVIVARLSAQSTPPSAPTDPPGNPSPDFSEPTTTPSQSDAPSDNARGPRNNGGPRDGGSGAGGGFFGGEGRNRAGQYGGRAEDFQAESQAAIAFFNQNSPNRMAYFSKLPEKARYFATVNLVRLYRPIQNFKDSNPILYQLLVKQVKLRDEAFELAKEDKDADLRTKAAEIVDVTIQARHMRLEILQKELTDQQASFEKYQANKDEDAEEEASAIKTDEQRMVQRVERLQNREHGTPSTLDFDPDADPLADAAPIQANPGS